MKLGRFLIMILTILLNEGVCYIQGLENLAFEKPTIQSSTELGGVSSRAVDGDTDPTWAHGSCTHTQHDTNPWWAVDLLMSRQADRVDITSTVGLTGIRLSHLHIGSTDENPNVTAPTLASLDECVSQDSPVAEGTTQIFQCGSTGRFLVIMLEGNHVLSLCEVKVFEENIALRQATFQSSTMNTGYSSKAVDGTRVNNYASGNCTRSVDEDNPWWAVDLQRRYLVERVHITSQACEYAYCIGYLRDLRIGLRDVNVTVEAPTLNNIDICAVHEGLVADGATVSFQCGKAGRYLVVMMESPSRELRLCEVEVYTSEAAPETFFTPDFIPTDPGPFNYRPSLNNSLTRCSLNSLTQQEQQTARQCYRECFVNPCCKAVNASSCEQSYVKTEALDFVKEGYGTTPTPECSCETQNFSVSGEFVFSTFDAYLVSGGNIRNITLYIDMGVKGIFIEYAGRHVSSLGFRSHHKHECILDHDERITGVDVYEGLNGQHKYEFPQGMSFHTTKQTCGPFGQTADGITYHASGHQLLFISGWAKFHIQLVTLHFDYDCTT